MLFFSKPGNNVEYYFDKPRRTGKCFLCPAAYLFYIFVWNVLIGESFDIRLVKRRSFRRESALFAILKLGEKYYIAENSHLMNFIVTRQLRVPLGFSTIQWIKEYKINVYSFIVRRLLRRECWTGSSLVCLN